MTDLNVDGKQPDCNDRFTILVITGHSASNDLFLIIRLAVSPVA